MSNREHLAHEAETRAPRKPRLAIMGEFSAGKSTLTNLLIGAEPLPMQVTATQLPTVWLTYGEESAFREDLNGNLTPLDINDLSCVVPDETRVIRVSVKADILELCDLIDMPGISDPNMSPEHWQPVIDQADLVVWCTHATQAWRQSEAAFWSTLDPGLYRRSLLLLTRFDKLLSEPDRRRVLQRVRRETEGLFAECFPVSLTMAGAAEGDPDRWEESGAAPFITRLAQLLEEVADGQSSPNGPAWRRESSVEDGQPHRPITTAAAAQGEGASEFRVVPRRVIPQSTSGPPTPRPTRAAPRSMFGDV
jgi:hypothetical protein